jgi:hypothetical protein
MAADRANPIPFPRQAVDAAFYMHKTIFSAVKGRKGHGFYQFAFVKSGTTDRTGMRIPWKPYAAGLKALALVGAVSIRSRQAYPYKQGITKPKQKDSNCDKPQNL